VIFVTSRGGNVLLSSVGLVFCARWRSSSAKRRRRAGGATSAPTPRLRSPRVATSQSARSRGTRVIRSSRSDSGPPRCSAWSRAGHRGRHASGSGGGSGDLNAHFDPAFVALTTTQTLGSAPLLKDIVLVPKFALERARRREEASGKSQYLRV
jgi:hypothetical protein